MAEGANQGDLVFPEHGIKAQLHLEAPVLPQGDGLGVLDGLVGLQDGGASRFLLGVPGAFNHHGREAVLAGMGVFFDSLNRKRQMNVIKHPPAWPVDV